MKQLYCLKRILAFVLAFIMVVSNINYLPVYAAGEETTTEVLFSTDFNEGNFAENGISKKGSGSSYTVGEYAGERCLYLYNGEDGQRLYPTNTFDLSATNNLTV